MGLIDDTASILSRKSHHSSKSTRQRRYSTYSRKSGLCSHSRASSPGAKSVVASFFGLDGADKKKHRRSRDNRSSFFGMPNLSSRSFFGGGDKHRSSTSHYRRSPRPDFFTRAYRRLRRLLHDLVYYAKRHPLKVLTLVLVPLITGGVLTTLLARFGLRLPPSIVRMLGIGARVMSYDAVGLVGEVVRMARGGSSEWHVRVERGRDGGRQWERKDWEGVIDSGFGSYGTPGEGWGVMKTVKGFF